MFDQSFNISPCDFAEVCPEVPLFESKNFEFEDVVLFNVSVYRPQVSVKGKLFKSIEHWQFLGAPDFILSIIKSRYKISFISTPPPQHYKKMDQPLTSANVLVTLFWNFCVTIVSKRCSLPLI